MCGVASHPEESAHSPFAKKHGFKQRMVPKVLQEHLLPTIQERFGEDTCIFQHDGAPCHKAKAIAKWLNDKNV